MEINLEKEYQEKISSLQKEIQDLQEENKKFKERKKYGLVWDNEKNKEQIVEDCKNKLPILERVKDKEIITDGTKPMNIMIEGDNYHALTCLNYTHRGKIDLIYIDPPYNTGNKDFIYNDHFVDEEDTFKHSKWLNFMDVRLRLAKNLLKDNGAIFCSIDDNEYPRLIMLFEDIFTEKNIKNICVKMSEATGVKMAGVERQGRIPKLKEYLIIAKKDGINNLFLERLPKEKWDDEYKTIIVNTTEEEILKVKEIRDNEDRTIKEIEKCNKLIQGWNTHTLSDYFSENNVAKKDQLNFRYQNAWRIIQIVTLTGSARDIARKIKKKHNSSLAFFSIITSRKKMYLIKGDFNDKTNLPRCKVLFADDYLTQHPCDFWSDIKTTGIDAEGGIKFKNGKKPLKLLERILKTYQKTDIKVLDFFAGSGTTGEAVLKRNKEDGGNRSFVLCTYNEENGTNIKIADEFCYPRVKSALERYQSNLHYFKADANSFISVKTIKNISDDKKLELTLKAGQLIAIKENVFDVIECTNHWQIFENGERQVAIYFTEDITELRNLLEKLNKNKKNIVYVFSWGKNSISGSDMGFDDVEIKDIPQPIINIYREIYRG